MPVKITVNGKSVWLQATDKSQTINLTGKMPATITADPNFYIRMGEEK